MDALGLSDEKNKIINAKNSVSDAIDKGVSRVKSAWNSSPLHGVLSGSAPETVYKYDEKPASKPAPKANAPTGGKKMPSYKHGTDYVPKTGVAKLHEGEAVLPKHKAEQYRDAKGELGSDDKPAKEISHIITRKGKKDGKNVHVHTHVHTHPMHHPDETHVTSGNDAMADHMMEHMGEPNPGEAEADAGQSGVEGMGAPTQGAPMQGA